jgi:imidazolonepropionase-like amidohydrolase
MRSRGAAAGVQLLAGTDAGMVPHGMIATEVNQLVRAGVSADIAVAAGSWAARSYLGLPGIEEGAPADIIALPSDPRTDLDALTQHSLTILDGGRLVAG